MKDTKQDETQIGLDDVNGGYDWSKVDMSKRCGHVDEQTLSICMRENNHGMGPHYFPPLGPAASIHARRYDGKKNPNDDDGKTVPAGHVHKHND